LKERERERDERKKKKKKRGRVCATQITIHTNTIHSPLENQLRSFARTFARLQPTLRTCQRPRAPFKRISRFSLFRHENHWNGIRFGMGGQKTVECIYMYDCNFFVLCVYRRSGCGANEERLPSLFMRSLQRITQSRRVHFTLKIAVEVIETEKRWEDNECCLLTFLFFLFP
jgi:hypothetical protein